MDSCGDDTGDNPVRWRVVYTRICVHQSIYVLVHSSISQFAHVSFILRLSIFMPVCISVYSFPSIRPSLSVCVCLSLYVLFSLYVLPCLPVCLSLRLPACLSACLYACLQACLPVCLPTGSPVCLPACAPTRLRPFMRTYVKKLTSFTSIFIGCLPVGKNTD